MNCANLCDPLATTKPQLLQARMLRPGDTHIAQDTTMADQEANRGVILSL